MQRLIKDLLHYSSLKTQITELQPTSLNEVVAQVLKNLKTSLDESGAVLNIQDLPRVKAKHSQMVQLFQNLIGNAVKFRSDKSLQITLSAVRQEKTWLISVKDNGIGIEPEHHVKIFQIFQRLNSQEKYAGSGIGLAISQEIVSAHGGNIWVESKPQKGTTFFFTLPAIE
jgi:light-regulated signal transduction histidine kinase (bacteriophytochrome)